MIVNIKTQIHNSVNSWILNFLINDLKIPFFKLLLKKSYLNLNQK